METDAVHRLLQQLLSIYNAYQKTKLECEKVNRDCRELLKPWPPKKEEVEAYKKAEEQLKAKETLRPEEQAELKEVSAVLNKAARTRQVQNKIREEREKIDSKYASRTRALSDKEAADDITIKTESTEPGDIKPCKNGPGVTVGAPVKPRSTGVHRNQVPVIKQSQLNKLLNTGGTKSAEKTRLSSSKSSASQKTHERPKSAGRGSQEVRVRTGIRHVPAHAKAPFQTVNETKRPSKSSRLKPVTRTSSANQVTKQPVKPHPQSKKTEPLKTETPVVGDSLHTWLDNTVKQTEQEHLEMLNEMKKDEVNDELNVKAMAEMTVSDANSPEKSSTEDVPKPKRFNLLTEGKTLTVPGRLKKALYQNHKLRTKAKAVSITTKVTHGEESLAESFLHKMQQHMRMSNPQCAKIRLICDAYHFLHRLLHSIPPTADGTTHWSEILKRKRIMEYILTAYANLESKYQALRKKYPPSDRLEVRKPPSMQNIDINTTSWWLPGHIQEPKQIKGPLQYRKHKAWRDLTSLLHKEQTLLLDQYLLQLMEEALLPIVMTPSRFSKEVYRCVHSLLCTNGSHIPTVLKDINAPAE